MAIRVYSILIHIFGLQLYIDSYLAITRIEPSEIQRHLFSFERV